MKIKVLLSMALSLALICSGTSAWAKVQGPCADCHTMHNSQDGAVVDGDGPSRSLTIGGCIGCHTGTNDGGNIPYVNQSGEPTYVSGAGATNATLAGGSFYWVGQDSAATDPMGHNVVGIAASDRNIANNTPPGFNSTTAGEVGILADWTANQLTCAGTYGCHGPHGAADDFTDLAGAHHGDTGIAADYRFLTGIQGIEDPDWEYSASATDRNVYHGQARSDASVKTDKATISYFCSTCHGDYHAGSEVVYGGSTIGENAWLRHPTDYDLNDAQGEYAAYNGDGTSYSVEAPVAADLKTLTGITTATQHDTQIDVTNTANTAIVTCISCHRAHGSPYADLLRWDYAGMEAGDTAQTATGEGCFVCHTTKDDA